MIIILKQPKVTQKRVTNNYSQVPKQFFFNLPEPPLILCWKSDRKQKKNIQIVCKDDVTRSTKRELIKKF